jgi:hypothetical protein
LGIKGRLGCGQTAQKGGEGHQFVHNENLFIGGEFWFLFPQYLCLYRSHESPSSLLLAPDDEAKDIHKQFIL